MESTKLNFKWVRQNFNNSKYAGQYVALLNGECVANDYSRIELQSKIDALDLDTRVLVVRVV